jgi:hypothetical protein
VSPIYIVSVELDAIPIGLENKEKAPKPSESDAVGPPAIVVTMP